MPVGPVALIEREPKPFALLHNQGILEALVRVAPPGSARLGRRVSEQQVVGYILVTGGRLLRQVVAPAEQFHHGPNQILLGHRLIRLLQRLEPRVHVSQVPTEIRELRTRSVPLRSCANSIGQEELCK